MHIKHEKNQWILACNDLPETVKSQWFKQEYWLNQGRLLGANSGRGAAWVIKSEWGKWILRHYFRGGLYAKLNKDYYFWTGFKRTRVFKEFNLLEHINQLGLPSPKPIGALVVKKGLFYQNDLLMEHINHQNTFAQWLLKVAESTNQVIWQNIGRTIAQYHRNGIFHADLNAHNILLSDDKVYIIDFDKGHLKSKAGRWQQDNISRFKRSIEKVTQQSCDKQLKSLWQALYDAYLEYLK